MAASAVFLFWVNQHFLAPIADTIGLAVDDDSVVVVPAIVDDHFESIDTIDVTASRTRLATTGASETFLDREEVQRMPHLADDAVRMLKILPGVTGGDYSAALNIRGAYKNEPKAA